MRVPTSRRPGLSVRLNLTFSYAGLLLLLSRAERGSFTREHVDLSLIAENTGEKLSPHGVSTLAEPFQRGTRRTRADHAGVGLGLAIVNSITQAHDGTLTLTARPEGGLRVTVGLPATPSTRGGET